MEDDCKKFIFSHAVALIEIINIEEAAGFAYKKGFLPIEKHKYFKLENQNESQRKQFEMVVSAIGYMRSVLLFCFLLSDCKGSFSELKKAFTEKVNKLSSTKLTTSDFSVLETSSVIFTSDMTEFHNLCREIVENGDEEMFLKIVLWTINDWKVVKNQKTLQRAVKQRTADLCLHANCLLSLFYDTDEYDHDFENEISQVIMFTSDPLESILLVSASKLQTRSRAAKKDLIFPENLRKYAVDANMLSKSYILFTEVMVLLSSLFKKSDPKVLNSIVKKLKKMKRTFREVTESKANELYRQNVVYRTNCTEALCRLRLAFNLENIPDVPIEQTDMHSVRNCLEYVFTPNVWNTMTLKWKMLAYAAISKWSHLNGDTEEAKMFSEKMKVLAPKIPCICKTTTLNNVEKLMATVQQPATTCFTKLKSVSTQESTFEEVFSDLVTFHRVGTDTIVVQTSASKNHQGPYSDTPFQYFLLLSQKEAYHDVCEKSFSHLKKKCISTLYEAVEKNDLLQTKIFIEEGSDPLLKNDMQVTPFQVALTLQNADILKELAKFICNEFRSQIESKQGDQLHDVWLGYIPNSKKTQIELKDIRLVVVVKHSSILDGNIACTKSFCDIPTEYRVKDEVDKESAATSEKEDIKKIMNREIPGVKVESLFKQHSKLNIVHVSSVKSRNFKINADTRNETCVALYCQIKGIVPLGEKPFPMTVDGLPTDVREGYCNLVGNGSLKLGTEVTSSLTGMSGSIGGFLVDETGRVAFLTAAHIAVEGQYLRFTREQQNGILPISIHGPTPQQNKVGEVIAWCFESDNNNQTCIDAALVMVSTNLTSFDNELSTKNVCTESGNEIKGLQVISGQPLPDHGEIKKHSGEILKCGMKTGVTRGKLVSASAHAKVSYIGLDGGACMYCQMLIESIEDKNFCKEGDSGAFCYLVDENDNTKIRPFAMIIAVADGSAVVTPLIDIFHKMSLDSKMLISGSKNDNRQSSSQQLSGQTSVNHCGNETVDIIHWLHSEMINGFENINQVLQKQTENFSNLNESIKYELTTIKQDIHRIKHHIQLDE